MEMQTFYENSSSSILQEQGANAFHEKAGECQPFSCIFSFFFFISSFFQIVPIEPSRLCRHPSIRTLC